MSSDRSNLRSVVIDTNILISGIMFGGKPRKVIDLVREKRLAGYTSEVLLGELLDILKDKFKLTELDLHQVEIAVRKQFVLIRPESVPMVVERDPDDNQVLAVAIEVGAEVIISGDKDLLSLESYQNIPIMTAGDFLKAK